MANPKRRHSKARTRTRRSTWKAGTPVLVRCPQCREYKPAHVVCPHCGSYRGRTAVASGQQEG